MKIEDHLKNVKESIEVIEESIEKGLQERQRNIGFNTSVACIDLLEIYLHQKHLIDPGFVIKHEWFRSQNKLKEKFPFDFPEKDALFDMITKIEEKRDILCYGKQQDIILLQEIIDTFNNVKKKFRELGVDEL